MYLSGFSKRVLLTTSIVSASFFSFAQKASGNIDDLVNRTWYILAMKCPGEVKYGGGTNHDKYMRYYFSLELKPNVAGNLHYGSYTRVATDMDTDPRQTGKYSITTDESGLPILTLTNSKNQATQYSFKVLDENHLTLSRLSESKDDKCNVHYAIAP